MISLPWESFKRLIGQPGYASHFFELDDIIRGQVFNGHFIAQVDILKQSNPDLEDFERNYRQTSLIIKVKGSAYPVITEFTPGGPDHIQENNIKETVLEDSPKQTPFWSSTIETIKDILS